MALLVLTVTATGALLLAAGCVHPATPASVSLAGRKNAPAVASVGGYVGNALCAECHRAEAEHHRTSRHAQTMRPLTRQALGALAPQTGPIAGTGYALTRLGDAYGFAAVGAIPQPIQLALGSGKTGMTYVGIVEDNALVEVHLSYFSSVRAKACPVNRNSGCIACHMPKHRVFISSDAPTFMADHYIRVVQGSGGAK